MELQHEPKIKLTRQGLVDDGVYQFKMESHQSWITFGKSSNSNTYTIFMIGTSPEFKNQGYATKLLNVFFQMVKKVNGNIMVESYTSAGEIWIRHVIEKLAKKHNVRILQQHD
jgi:GNAT superfamily N-acetyltransferase